MHFIGMLAVQLPVAVTYDILWTLVSALVCILVVGLGVFVASFGRLHPWRLATAGLLMGARSEEHTSELQSLMRISYAVFCLKKKKTTDHHNTYPTSSPISQPIRHHP